MPDTAARNARLDELETSVKAYIKKQREEYQLRVDTAKKILKGRTGSERLTQAAVQGAQPLVIDEINAFLIS